MNKIEEKEITELANDEVLEVSVQEDEKQELEHETEVRENEENIVDNKSEEILEDSKKIDGINTLSEERVNEIIQEMNEGVIDGYKTIKIQVDGNNEFVWTDEDMRTI